MGDNWIGLAGGTFVMGSQRETYSDEVENIARHIELDPFEISAYAVTNSQFQAFVEATGYRTEAERFGWSYVYHTLVPDNSKQSLALEPQEATKWLAVNGAYWAQPEGPDSQIGDRWDHPVVHISWNDAASYCIWSGTRLPTEAEWEYAARGGLEEAEFPWGDQLERDGNLVCNTGIDASGRRQATVPVDAYEPNGYGLYNIAGNVWEWCADWFEPRYHRVTSSRNPRQTLATGRRSQRGGSFLREVGGCGQYRVATRNSNMVDCSASHIGFRVVRSSQFHT